MVYTLICMHLFAIKLEILIVYIFIQEKLGNNKLLLGSHIPTYLKIIMVFDNF